MRLPNLVSPTPFGCNVLARNTHLLILVDQARGMFSALSVNGLPVGFAGLLECRPLAREREDLQRFGPFPHVVDVNGEIVVMDLPVQVDLEKGLERVGETTSCRIRRNEFRALGEVR